MNSNILPLHKIPVGTKAKVIKLLLEDISRRRMLDLGLINGTVIESLRKSPSGDPIAYGIRGAVIALRSEEASKIIVETL